MTTLPKKMPPRLKKYLRHNNNNVTTKKNTTPLSIQYEQNSSLKKFESFKMICEGSFSNDEVEYITKSPSYDDDKRRIMFSFLLPTRERVSSCKASIDSLYHNADDKLSFEVLMAFDDDDQETREMVLDHCKFLGVQYQCIVTRRYGYRQLHLYVNKLCRMARGEYLWLWNDDATIETNGWDTIVEQLTKDQPDMVFDFINNHFVWIFPLVPKKYIDLLGHFSLNAHNDSWIQNVFEPLQLTTRTDKVSLYHNRNNPIFDINYQDVNTDIHVSLPEFFSPFANLLRTIDSNRIAHMMGKTTLPLPNDRTRVGFIFSSLHDKDKYIEEELQQEHYLLVEKNVETSAFIHPQLRFTENRLLIFWFAETIYTDRLDVINDIQTFCQEHNFHRTIVVPASLHDKLSSDDKCSYRTIVD